MKSNTNIIQVVKYGNEYFEVGDIVELVVDTYLYKTVVGKIIEFTASKTMGVTCYEKIKIDASEKYNSNIKEFDISRILRISHLKL